MIASSFTLGLRQHPATTTAWHLCTVIIPRRTITGRLVRGQVWRRHDGRHWLYKKFIAQGSASRTTGSGMRWGVVSDDGQCRTTSPLGAVPGVQS
jgi:hypothetical protein